MTGPASPSFRELTDDLAGDAQRLVDLQVELAKQEAREVFRRNLVAIGLLIGAGTIAAFAILLVIPLVLTAVYPDRRLLVTVVVVGAYLLVAVIAALVGRAMLDFTPTLKTIDSVKETARWALRQLSSNKR
jgi:uncharacterized membrane protein YqjE